MDRRRMGGATVGGGSVAGWVSGSGTSSSATAVDAAAGPARCRHYRQQQCPLRRRGPHKFGGRAGGGGQCITDCTRRD
eukprot:gene2387-7049_t